MTAAHEELTFEDFERAVSEQPDAPREPARRLPFWEPQPPTRAWIKKRLDSRPVF